MKKKIIVGFLGDKNVGKTTASHVLEKYGFYRVSIKDKISEIAKKFFPDQLEERICDEIRRRGNKAHKGYWLNLVLVSVPDDKDKVVFDDLTAEDLLGDYIKVYQIFRPIFSTNQLPNIETIVNDSDINAFENNVIRTCKSLGKKK